MPTDIVVLGLQLPRIVVLSVAGLSNGFSILPPTQSPFADEPFHLRLFDNTVVPDETLAMSLGIFRCEGLELNRPMAFGREEDQ